MPEPRSISELPSTSRITPPPAAVDEDRQGGADAVGDVLLLPGQLLRDRGPGISVTRLRCWVRDVPPATVVLMAAAYGRADCGFHRSPYRRSTDSVAPIDGALCCQNSGHGTGYGSRTSASTSPTHGCRGSTGRRCSGWQLELHDDGDAHLRDDAGRIQVWLNVVPEPKSVKNRVHIDVNAESVQRAIDAGARVDSEFPRWTTLLDPDGQEHCVFPRAEPIAKRAYELGWDCAEGAAGVSRPCGVVVRGARRRGRRRRAAASPGCRTSRNARGTPSTSPACPSRRR